MYDLRSAMTGGGQPNPFQDPLAQGLAQRPVGGFHPPITPQLGQSPGPQASAGGGDLAGLLQMLMPMMGGSGSGGTTYMPGVMDMVPTTFGG